MRGLAPNLSISGDCTEEWVIVKKITLTSLLPAGWRLWTVKTVSAYEGLCKVYPSRPQVCAAPRAETVFPLSGPTVDHDVVCWLWGNSGSWSDCPCALQSDCPTHRGLNVPMYCGLVIPTHHSLTVLTHRDLTVPMYHSLTVCIHHTDTTAVPMSNMVYLQQHHILAEMLYRLHGLEGSDLNQSHRARSHVCLHSRRFFLPVEDDYTILTIFSSSREIWTWNNFSVEGEFDRACPSRVDGRTLTRKLSCFFALKCIALSTKQLQNFPNKCRCQCSTTVHMNPNFKWCFMKSFVFLLPQRKSGLWFSGDSASFESTFSQFFYYLFRRKSFQGTAKTWQINICNLLLGLIGKTAVSRYSKPEWLWAILLVCTDNLLKYILSFFSFSKGEIKSLKKVFRKRGCCELSLTSFQIPTGCSFLCTVLPWRRQRKMYLVALMLSYILYSLTEP